MNPKSCVVVCVANPENSEQLIRAGVSVAEKQNLNIKVIHIRREKEASNPNAQEIEKLYHNCQVHSVPMAIYFNDTPDLVAATYAMKEKGSVIVTGFSKTNSSPFTANMRLLLPETIQYGR